MSQHSVKSLQDCYKLDSDQPYDANVSYQHHQKLRMAVAIVSSRVLVTALITLSYSVPVNAMVGDVDIKEIFSQVANTHRSDSQIDTHAYNNTYTAYNNLNSNPSVYTPLKHRYRLSPTAGKDVSHSSNETEQSKYQRTPQQSPLDQLQPDMSIQQSVQLPHSDTQANSSQSLRRIEEEYGNSYVPVDYANMNVNQHELAIMHVLSKVCPKLLNPSQNSHFDQAFNKKLHDLLPNVKNPKSAMKYLSTQQDYRQLLSSMETWTLSFPDSENQELCEDIVNYQY